LIRFANLMPYYSDMIKTCAALSLLVLVSATLPARAGDPPTVVELFTSEGCSSCPPADALLIDLSNRPDVLALSFHVDYWDRLGWKDPFSSPAATARQRQYARLLGIDTVYTPQMVIDGRREAVGSDRAAVERALAAVRREPDAVPVTLSVNHGEARITMGQGGGAASASVVLIGFDRRHVDAVERGENSGRTLTHVDVVRGIEEIGRLSPVASEIVVAPPWQSDRLAAIIQAPDGRILGAAVADRNPAEPM
jgi:hypothetical protein